jgi:hypothetical protein
MGGRETYHNDFPAHQGLVERGNTAGSLSVVVWQTSPQDETNTPHDKSDTNAYASHETRVGLDETSTRSAGLRDLCQLRTPVPEGDDVDLLRALNNAGTVHPAGDGSTALVTEVQGKENRAAGTCERVETRSDVLGPSSGAHPLDIGSNADEQERHSVELRCNY